MTNEIKVGDKVRVKHSGRNITVQAIEPESMEIYFDNMEHFVYYDEVVTIPQKTNQQIKQITKK